MTAITGRYLRTFARVPQMFIFGALQPIVFVLGLDAVFGGLVEGATGVSYIQYLLPGVVVMHVVFTGGITSVGLAEDLQAGIVDRFRSLPISRAAVLVGRTNADLVRNAIGLAMAVGAGVALGFRWRGSVAGVLAAVVLLVAFSYALSWLFACIGMAVPPQAAQLASFLPTLPLVYLSSAWVPVESIDDTVQSFARHQPINVVVATLRSLADGAPVGSYAWQAIAWTAGIFAVSVLFAVRLYGRASSRTA